MVLLTKPSELKKKTVFKGLIYGNPGIGKTTMALSAPRPLCIDLDKGIDRVEKRFQVDSLQVDNYQQILDLVNGDEIKPFDTLVIDTLGKLIDKMGDWLAIKNPKVKQASGQLTMRGWGAVKQQFLIFFKILESKNKSIIFVAHEKEERRGEEVKVRPDVAGSSGKEIVKELDFMGYMEMRGGRRTISFRPSELYYAKNSLGLNDIMQVPDTKKGNNFIMEKIVKLTQIRMEDEAKMRIEYDELKEKITKETGELKTLEDVNKFYKKLTKDIVHIWDTLYVAKKLLNDVIKNLRFEFDKEKKVFVEKKAEEKKEDEKKENVNNNPIKKGEF